MNGFAEGCLEVYENRTDNLSNNLRLTEISMLIFFQFYCKIKRNLFEIVAEALMVYTHTNTFRGDTYMSSTLRGDGCKAKMRYYWT